MSKFTLLRNKFIRRFAQIFSLAAIGFVFQACYGPPRNHPDFFDISIKLSDESDAPLKDMVVIINDSIRRTTDEDGYFWTEMSRKDAVHSIHITGNGIYEPFDTIVTSDKYQVWLDLKLKKK